MTFFSYNKHMEERVLFSAVEPEVVIQEVEDEISEKRAGILKSLTITVFLAFVGILLLSWITISLKIKQDASQISTQNTTIDSTP